MAGWLGAIGTKVLPRCSTIQTRVSVGEVLTPSLWQRLVLASHRTAHTQTSWSAWTRPRLCHTASQGPSILCQGQGQGLHALARLGRPSPSKDLASLLRRHAYTDSKGYTHFDGGGTNRFGLSPMGRGVAVVVLGGGALYYYRSIETIPYTGRRHAIMFVSLAQERAMGKQVFAEQVMTARQAGTLLPPHHPYVRVVQRVGMTVAKIAAEGAGGGYNQHMKGLEWEFAVIQNPVPNAFVVPGGKVVVFSGLLDLLASEAELAAVLAHETAHVVARHHAERISTLNAFALVKLLSYFLFGIGLPNSAMILGVFLPYSRLAEYEADEIGLILMAKACFDPAAAPSMLSKLHAKEQSLERLSLPTPAFLRTHPLTDARVVRVEEQLPQAYEVYQESGCGIVGGFLDSVKRGAPAWA